MTMNLSECLRGLVDAVIDADGLLDDSDFYDKWRGKHDIVALCEFARTVSNVRNDTICSSEATGIGGYRG